MKKTISAMYLFRDVKMLSFLLMFLAFNIRANNIKKDNPHIANNKVDITMHAHYPDDEFQLSVRGTVTDRKSVV